jgi:phage/plasmid-like protein (TIGR03299 family)
MQWLGNFYFVITYFIKLVEDNFMNSLNLTTMATSSDGITGTPWANLGAIVPKNATVDETLVAAGLDWEVLRAETVLRVKIGDDEIIKDIPNPKSFGLLRSSDLSILSPFLGPRYKPIQNRDAFTVFQEFVQAGQMTMETAGSFSNGKHIWGLARTGHSFQLANGEFIDSYFLLLQSHVYGCSLKAMWTPIRFPGGHTLVQNITNKKLGGRTTYTMSHARHFNEARVREIKEVVGIAKRSMEEFQGKTEFMARMQIDPVDAISYLTQIFDPKLAGRCDIQGVSVPRTFAEIQDSPANRNLKKLARMIDATYRAGNGTAWGCWSTVNQAFDHEMGHGDNTRLESIWLGKNKSEKMKAFDLANILATAKGQ